MRRAASTAPSACPRRRPGSPWRASQHILEPDDIADAVLFLASDKGGYVTGWRSRSTQASPSRSRLPGWREVLAPRTPLRSARYYQDCGRSSWPQQRPRDLVGRLCLLRGGEWRACAVGHRESLVGGYRMPLAMAMPTAIRTRPPRSSPRSPALAPSRLPSSSPARDMVMLTPPMMTAATGRLTWKVPRAKPTA